MDFTSKFLILIWLCACAKASVTPVKPEKPSNTDSKESNAQIKDKNTETENKQRDKRQLTYVPTTSPVFFDPATQQQSGLLGFGQNIPIIGTLVSGLPLVGNGQNLLAGLPGGLGNGLGGLTSGLTGTLGSLTGGLGNLGQLGGLGNLLGGSAPSVNNAASCPAGQKLACRCDALIAVAPVVGKRNIHDGIIEIEDQSIKKNVDGSTETAARLSNGVYMYQEISNQISAKEIDGFYSLKVANNRYLTIYYTINDSDYTVKADVNSEPPKTHMEIDDGHQNLLGHFQIPN